MESGIINNSNTNWCDERTVPPNFTEWYIQTVKKERIAWGEKKKMMKK